MLCILGTEAPEAIGKVPSELGVGRFSQSLFNSVETTLPYEMPKPRFCYRLIKESL